MSHTPGPWELLDGRNIKTINGIFYLAYGCDEHSKMPFFFPKGWSELDANAKLTAAAPEMLKCLQAIVARIHGVYDDPALIEWGGLHHDSDQDILEHAEKLIAKATGDKRDRNTTSL